MARSIVAHNLTVAGFRTLRNRIALYSTSQRSISVTRQRFHALIHSIVYQASLYKLSPFFFTNCCARLLAKAVCFRQYVEWRLYRASSLPSWEKKPYNSMVELTKQDASHAIGVYH